MNIFKLIHHIIHDLRKYIRIIVRTVRTFTIDMKIVVDGFERVERYQFYLDENGEWIFEKVDLASFGRL